MKVNKFTVYRTILLLLTTLLYFNCGGDSFNSKEDLLTYLKDDSNGYIKYKNVNGYDFTLMYRPTDLLVEQELYNLKEKPQDITLLRKKYKDYLYFNLSISKNNEELLSAVPNTMSEFSRLVSQLTFNMDTKVHLYNNKKDTIPMLDYVYPRMYGMAKSTTMMFIYPRSKTVLQEDHINFTIQDFGLYTGEVKFKILVNQINNEPKLVFKK